MMDLKIFIFDVYVLNFHQNLLSVGQLSKKMYNMWIYKGAYTINDDKKILIVKVYMT